MRKKIIFVIFSLLLLIAIPLTFLVVQQQQDIRNRAAPATTMELLSDTTPPSNRIEVAVGDTVNVNVVLSTEQNDIYSVQAIVSYDQAIVELIDVTYNPAYFQELVTEAALTPGIARLHTSTSLDNWVNGNNIIAGSFRFRAIAPGTFALTQTSDSNAFLYEAEPDTPELGVVISKPSLTIVVSDGTSPTEPPADNPSGGATPTLVPGASISPSDTTTLTPSPSITLTEEEQEALVNAEADTNAEISEDPTPGPLNLTITTPTNTATTTDTTPTFSGTAKAASVISFSFTPTGRSDNVTTNASGAWSYTPTLAFGLGTYTVVISASDLTSGQNEAKTLVFTIGTTSSTNTPTPSPTQVKTATTKTTTISPTAVSINQASPVVLNEDIPVTGSVETTLAIVLVGILLLLGGAALPMFMK